MKICTLSPPACRPLWARARFWRDPHSVCPGHSAEFHRRDLPWLCNWLELCGFVFVGEERRVPSPGGEGHWPPPHWQHRNLRGVSALVQIRRGGRCDVQTSGLRIDELLPPEVWIDAPEVLQ